ncbi:MAG: hypothetical protein D3905_10995 [Candidatus Electrothrix sp. AS4_5]|nr:hypothetical protein [Candidatus Electrothrix gigas]
MGYKRKINYLIREIKRIPPEYFPNLLQLIRVFRETALFGKASQNKAKKKEKRYPLRGLPFTYTDPTEPLTVKQKQNRIVL